MASQRNSFYRILNQYFAVLLAIPLAFFLWTLCGSVSALMALVLGLASLVSTRYLMHQVERVSAQKSSLDQQLIQSHKLASIGELSSGIAHEINNPLAIIGQEAEWLWHLLSSDAAKGVERFSEVSDSLQEIGRQVGRCREITHKMLDLARKSEPLIQSVDLNRLIEDMAKLVERESTTKNIRLIRDYQKDLPTVHTDPPLIRQVVLNVLNNAAYAVQKDGSITVRTSLSGSDSIDIQVIDTGCGIADNQLNNIFDPFFTTKPPGKGTGLGLSICHRIIEKLGGGISVSSKVGKGTTFTIHLPVEQRKGEL